MSAECGGRPRGDDERSRSSSSGSTGIECRQQQEQAPPDPPPDPPPPPHLTKPLSALAGSARAEEGHPRVPFRAAGAEDAARLEEADGDGLWTERMLTEAAAAAGLLRAPDVPPSDRSERLLAPAGTGKIYMISAAEAKRAFLDRSPGAGEPLLHKAARQGNTSWALSMLSALEHAPAALRKRNEGGPDAAARGRRQPSVHSPLFLAIPQGADRARRRPGRGVGLAPAGRRRCGAEGRAAGRGRRCVVVVAVGCNDCASRPRRHRRRRRQRQRSHGKKAEKGRRRRARWTLSRRAHRLRLRCPCRRG